MNTIGAFNLAGPPRTVPLLIKIKLLFGGVRNQGGWFFLGVSLAVVQIVTVDSDLTSLHRFWGELVTVKGMVANT
jgi:hypothetical protein